MNYVEPPTIPAGMTIAEYRRQRARRYAVQREAARFRLAAVLFVSKRTGH